MMQKIEQLKIQALEDVRQAENGSDLEDVKYKYLGRQDGELTKVLRNIKSLSVEQKSVVGSLANNIRKEIKEAIKIKQKKLFLINKKEIKSVDLTLPGQKIAYGSLHPLTQACHKVAEIFSSMGFEILDGVELETDYYNFEALNIPAGHPARDMWDTFYVKSENNDKLLRTHTSAMQVRIMEKREPPLKICVIGRCFRHEATDASHEHTLNQVEGFVVDKNITIANLIYTLKAFLKALFEREVKIRLRPSYFPFTEPSFEVDFSCLNCGGHGCPICKQSGWLEMVGSGMIHPKVLENAGYPKGVYSGFAFGAGLDRLVIMKHKIDDIRWFHSGDLRFVRQF